jgi:Tol biopolymer transport system component
LVPDGKKIVYEGRDSIYVINVDGTGATQLVADTEQPEERVSYINPSWSPDGNKIVFVRITFGISEESRAVTENEIQNVVYGGL